MPTSITSPACSACASASPLLSTPRRACCRHSPRTPSSTCSTPRSCPGARCRRAASRWPTPRAVASDVMARRLPSPRQGGALPRGRRSPGCSTTASEDGDTIGLRIEAGRAGALCYVPGCARLDDALKARLHGAAVLLFDGTLYTDDEMVTAGVGTKTGKRMGHISHVAARTARSPRWPRSPSAAASSSMSTTPTRCSTRPRPSMPRCAKPAGKSPMTAWRSPCDGLPRRRARRLGQGRPGGGAARRSAPSATTTGIPSTTA